MREPSLALWRIQRVAISSPSYELGAREEQAVRFTPLLLVAACIYPMPFDE
jgi:hypothetical protein